MKTSEPIPTLQHIRRQYAPYLRRGDAIRLCATLGAGSAAFKRWCRRSPVPDLDFRVVLAGYKEFHYLRETILAHLHPEAAASCSPAPYYEADGITLYLGDMRDIVPHLQPVDAVVTDPPYNETSCEWDVWPSGWPSMLTSLTNSLWCFGSMRMFWDRVGEFSDWKLAQDIIWEKHNGSGARTDRFRRIHEIAVHLYRGQWEAIHKATPVTMDAKKITANRRQKPGHWSDIGNSNFASEEGGPRLMQSIIYARSCHGYAVNETQKPEAIVAPLLEYAVPPGGAVLDCFAGSGTVLAVARSQGKRAVGIESRESQCREIVKRLSQRELSLGNSMICGDPAALSPENTDLQINSKAKSAHD